MAKQMRPEQITHSRHVKKAVRRVDGKVRPCKSSHFVATVPGHPPMTCVEGEMSKYMRCKVVKWLQAVGALAVVLTFVSLVV